MRDRAEDDRRDDHLYQLDETVSQRFERFTGIREEPPDQNADEDGDKNLNVKNPIPGLSSRRFLHGGRGLIPKTIFLNRNRF